MEGRASWLVTLLLAIFGGVFGLHRFYTGHIVTGILQFVTAGGCGIWYVLDIVWICLGVFHDSEGRPLQR
jgi:TM2 domain-containing membrane protein YozV